MVNKTCHLYLEFTMAMHFLYLIHFGFGFFTIDKDLCDVVISLTLLLSTIQ